MSEQEERLRVIVEDDRTGMHPDTLERAVLDHLNYTCSKDVQSATPNDVYLAVSHAVRDRLVQRWIKTQRTYYRNDVKRAYYLSAEFLLGRFLGINLLKLGLWEHARRGLSPYGLDLEEVLAQEPDPGLGNGGLGRLAACFLDSLATLELPAYGYGIRYEFGIFEQRIHDGWQQEVPDAWARNGNPWEMPRYEYSVPLRLYGHVRSERTDDGRYVARWEGTKSVVGVPYDMPIAGYGNHTVNTLRLWQARASRDLDLAVFNAGDYRAAVEDKAMSESISKVLYPNDHSPEGRELRLKQQYFFVACSIADIIRRYEKDHDSFDAFADKVAIQLNDTHPAIAVAELMRVLVDERGVPWNRAWHITRGAIAYTNHTLLAEALETWSVGLFEYLLPRHLQIIYEINARFLSELSLTSGGDDDRARRLSLIEEGDDKKVRMAHLAVVGSHRVNGVAELHSQLVREELLRDFAELWPERFVNKTNGVTPRRWMLLANRDLAALVRERIGDEWITDLARLRDLMRWVDDEPFLAELAEVKQRNKVRLVEVIARTTGVTLDPASIFDTHVKRIHMYKRQLLNVLHIISLYAELRDGADRAPRTFIFGGKAAPGYWMAKLIVKLIHDVAAVLEEDPRTRDRLRVVFVPNYGVSLAERIIPGSDVSEQISMAGKEASGTGNMKFAMNGALTIGTLDGANVEIREAVGAEHIFIFGLTVDQVRETHAAGYRPRAIYESRDDVRAVVDAIGKGAFSAEHPHRFEGLMNGLLADGERYVHLADFASYLDAQREVEALYGDRDAWTKKSILNSARMGRFSSDETIRDYAKDIWGVPTD